MHALGSFWYPEETLSTWVETLPGRYNWQPESLSFRQVIFDGCSQARSYSKRPRLPVQRCSKTSGGAHFVVWVDLLATQRNIDVVMPGCKNRDFLALNSVYLTLWSIRYDVQLTCTCQFCCGSCPGTSFRRQRVQLTKDYAPGVAMNSVGTTSSRATNSQLRLITIMTILSQCGADDSVVIIANLRANWVHSSIQYQWGFLQRCSFHCCPSFKSLHHWFFLLFPCTHVHQFQVYFYIPTTPCALWYQVFYAFAIYLKTLYWRLLIRRLVIPD